MWFARFCVDGYGRRLPPHLCSPQARSRLPRPQQRLCCRPFLPRTKDIVGLTPHCWTRSGPDNRPINTAGEKTEVQRTGGSVLPGPFRWAAADAHVRFVPANWLLLTLYSRRPETKVRGEACLGRSYTEACRNHRDNRQNGALPAALKSRPWPDVFFPGTSK